MDKDYYAKTKSVLEDLIKCLKTSSRDGFYGVNNNIYSLMFNDHELKSEFSIILPNEVAGFFSNMMWDISQTGAYFSSKIAGYNVSDIIKCSNAIISVLDKEILKEIQTDTYGFYNNLLTACSLMQDNIVYHDRTEKIGKEEHKIIVKEDYRNYFLRDLFDFKGLYVRGQEHQGVSPKGGGAGEVDLLICKTDSQPKIYLEGMNLDSLNSSKIDEHYEKLFLYDASINKNNYLLSYVTVASFENFCTNYKNHFENYKGEHQCSKVNEIPSEYSNIKVILSETKKGEDTIYTYHVLVLFEKY